MAHRIVHLWNSDKCWHHNNVQGQHCREFALARRLHGSGRLHHTTNGRGNTNRIATLTIKPIIKPPNDKFQRAIAIRTGQTLTGSNINATKELAAGEPKHANNIGGKSVWWKFTPPTKGQFSVSTAGSNVNTVLGVYVGDTVGTLTRIASNNDDRGNFTSLATFAAKPGTIYHIAVDGYNAGGGAESGKINISVSRN